MLFGGYAGHRLEPVCIMSSALFDSPFLHCVSDSACDLGSERTAELLGIADSSVNVLGKPFAHNLVVEDVTAEKVSDIL